MDPLSISASIAGLLALTGHLIQYLSNVEKASEARETLLMEVSITSGLLYSLKDLCQQVEPHSEVFMSLRSLNSPKGPFDMFKKNLELLAAKVTPMRNRDKVKKALTWHFEQGEINSLMDMIQSQKTYYILALQGNHLLLTQMLSRSVSDIDAGICELHKRIHSLTVEQGIQGSRQQLKYTSGLLAWLSPLMFEDRFQSTLGQVQPGTGRWLLQHDLFIDWLKLRDDSTVLWLPGIPGSGKTSLAAIIIDHLQKTLTHAKVGIAYLFCDYRDPGQTFERLQRAILRQLLQQMDGLPIVVEELYDRYLRASIEPDAGEIRDLLMSATSQFSQTFVVIDALDEVAGSQGVANGLLKLCKEFGTGSHILVTSRWTGELDRYILQVPYIEILAQDQDISLYLHHELLKRERIHRFVQKDPTFEADVVDSILRHCKGMFLVARLHIESLATRTNLRAAKLALQQLPTTLDELYSNTIDRINRQDEEDKELAWRAISWIVRSTKPLTAIQLQHALAVDSNSDCLDHDAFVDLDIILAVCVGLVVLEANSSTLRLVHFTVQEFFERLGPKLLPRADCDISRACLRYLSYGRTAYFSTTDDDLNNKLESFPLFDYAAGNWGVHVAKCIHSGCNLDDDVWEFLGDSGRVAGAVQAMLLPSQRHRGFSQDLVGNVTPSHLAAHFGLFKTIRVLLEIETPDCRDDAGRTSLHWAARRGQTHIAELLLENGAEVDALDNVRATSLHLACRYGHHELASVLIANGCDVNAVNNVGGTALIWAALGGSLEIATLLLRHKADVNATTKDGMTALGQSVETENEAMVLLLIKHGAEVNDYIDNPRRSPLYIATRKSNEVIMRILLEAGAIPDILTSQLDISKTTVGSAIMAKVDGPLRLLLEYGLDPNRRGASGENLIHYAVRLGNLMAISTLVEFGGLMDSVGDNGNTVLHAAVSKGNG